MTDVSRGVGTRKERLFERAVYCFSYDDNEYSKVAEALGSKQLGNWKKLIMDKMDVYDG